MVGAALSPVIGKLVEGHQPRPFIVFGLACSALSMFALDLLDTTSSVFLHLLPGLTVNSIGFAFVAISTKVAPTERVAPQQQGRVSALITISGRLARVSA